ncbi:MAG: DUF2155 domain-containing protein [Rhodobacteraceae bacterium]|nr:DUF2155 domain-containing protein [Paracoccaceae bacterium]
MTLARALLALLLAAGLAPGAMAQDGGTRPPPPPPDLRPDLAAPEGAGAGAGAGVVLPEGGTFLSPDEMPVFDPFAEPAPNLEQPRELQPGELVLDPTPESPGVLRRPAMATPPPEAPRITVTAATGAVLHALDKLSGEVRDLTLATGQSAEFGRITVRLDECRYPTDNPAGDAFAHVVVLRQGAAAPQFTGWMIASSPALSSLDDPRYDVWVSRCTTS